MGSSATLSDRSQKVSRERATTIPATKTASPLRTVSSSSFSSSSSLSPCSSLYILDDSPLSPGTPLRFSGVPFSWEHSPGIPKNQSYKKKDCSSKDLPLPPPAASTSISKRFNSEEIGARKKNNNDSFRRDPFFAAFVECSKDEDDRDSSNNSFWAGPKVSRSISDRFGFINLYSSCKKSSAVSESIVYLPRSSRTSYDIISRRSR
ncbi:trinucleotide repeat-containing protein [Salix suchowensis]|nr:trinucleotide repeat-containing protein [Salix suchowensis]